MEQIFHGKIRKEAILHANFRALFDYTQEKFGQSPAYAFRAKPRAESIERSFVELSEDLNYIGTALQQEVFHDEVQEGDDSLPELKKRRIAVMGDNSYPWILTNNAVMLSDSIAVPLDKQLTLSEALNLLERAEVSTIILDNDKYEELISTLSQGFAALKNIVLIDTQLLLNNGQAKSQERVAQLDATDPASLLQLAEAQDKSEVLIWRFEDLYYWGKARYASGDHSFLEIEEHPDEVCAIFFTSGTSAASKGVMLTPNNILANVRMVEECIDLPQQARILSILPLNHIFENAGELAFLAQGFCICFNDGLRHFTYNLKDWQIEGMMTVPLILDRVYKQVQDEVKKKNMEKAFNFLRKLSRFLLRFGLDLRHKLFKSVYDALSNKLSFFIVGAAHLREEVQAFFYDIGMIPYSGYGMTECAPLISNNSLYDYSIGSVGTPCARISVKIEAEHEDGSGEILVKSPGNMKGYYRDPAATAETLTTDGWLRTGDVGKMNKQGHIFITGRTKSMIVLANGKKAFPEEIETLLGEIDDVREKMAFGATNQRNTVDVAVLFQIDEESLSEGTLPTKTIEKIRQAIEWANAHMPDYKRIKYWAWTSNPFVMTSTLKIKRNPTIEKLYSFLESSGLYMRDFNMARVQL